MAKINQNNIDKKRLLVIITQSEFGGAQRFIFTLTTRLNQSDNYEILVATGSDGGGELLSSLRSHGIKTREINSLRRDIKLSQDFSAIFEIRKRMKNFNPDILFLNSSKASFN